MLDNLTEIQQQLQDFLLSKETAEVPSDNTALPDVETFIETRLQIYKNSYQINMTEALAKNYPLLTKYLGETQFHELGRQYLTKYPSQNRSIRWFGNNLPTYLLKSSEYQNTSFLAELARFEWALSLAYDAKIDPIIKVEDLIQLPPDAWAEIRLQPISALSRLDFAWNILPLWESLAEDAPIPKLETSEQKLPYLVWRQGFQLHYCSLPSAEAWAFDAFSLGATFTEVTEGLCQWITEEEVGIYIAGLLKGWIAAELISKII